MGMDDVDWTRYIGVHSRAVDGTGATHTPLGDPTRWGARSSVTLAKGAAGFNVANQIARTQCSDNYSRAWLITGTLEASSTVWDSTPPEVVWEQFIDIWQGVGQTSFVQRLSLRALVALATGTVYRGITSGDREARPWVISGGIFANAVGVSLVTLYTGEGAGPEETFVTNLNIAPLNAGSGL